MTIPIIRYELDTTGENPNNKVVGEIRSLSNNDLRAVAPSYGAYFTESLIVKDSELDEQLAIVKGVVNPNTIEVVDIL